MKLDALDRPKPSIRLFLEAHDIGKIVNRADADLIEEIVGCGFSVCGLLPGFIFLLALGHSQRFLSLRLALAA
jgi:hypothetical protein